MPPTKRRKTSRNGKINVLPEEQNRPNAFLIREVLENIFKQSKWDFQDLKNIRLVCRLWCDESLSLWRSTATVCLLQDEEPVGMKGIQLTSFSKLLVGKNNGDPFQLKKKPFSKYKLLQWKLKIDTGSSDWEKFGALKKLWKTFGSHIKHLTLEGCDFQECLPHPFVHIIYDGSPNLKHLVLHASDCEYKHVNWVVSALENTQNKNVEHLEVMKMLPFRRNSRVEFGFHIFLKTFPQLKTLKMEGLGEEFFFYLKHPDLFKLLQNNFFRTIFPEGHLPLIRHLDLMHWNLAPLSNTIPMSLNTILGFPLEFLSVDLNYHEGSQDELRQLVEPLRSTLRVLKVFVAPFCRPHKVGIPNPGEKVSEVEDLELWGNVVEDFDFLLEMPKLKKLRMSYDCFEKRKYIENTYSKQGIYTVRPEDFLKKSGLAVFAKLREEYYHRDIKMEHLTEFHIDLKFGEEEFKFFADKMPNLRSFKSIFDSSTFPDFLRVWKNGKLEELHALYGSDLNDTAIVGNRKSRSSPNLKRLKELRSFTLETYCDVGQLTDESARYGFLKIKFNSLKICVSPQFSHAMEENLKGHIKGHVEVVRNYGDHKGECCARLDLKKKALVPREQVDGEDTRIYHLLKREDLVEAGSLM